MARAKGQVLPNSRKLQVRDLMEKGLTPAQIMERLGMTRSSVNQRIVEIRRELGWQAV